MSEVGMISLMLQARKVSFWEFVTRLESREQDGGVRSQEELSDQTLPPAHGVEARAAARCLALLLPF